MVRQSGFEPELLAWKARVIPGYTTGAQLNYYMRPPGFEPGYRPWQGRMIPGYIKAAFSLSQAKYIKERCRIYRLRYCVVMGTTGFVAELYIVDLIIIFNFYYLCISHLVKYLKIFSIVKEIFTIFPYTI